jgi:hypothetical protein
VHPNFLSAVPISHSSSNRLFPFPLTRPLLSSCLLCRTALQGAFLEHINLLKRLRLPRGHEIDVIAVRTEEDLKSCGGLALLVLPLACVRSSRGCWWSRFERSC